MISEKHIEKINKIIKDMVFDFHGEVVSPGLKADFQYQFQINGQRKMISVGELYDYLTVSVEILDGDEKTTKIFAVLTELNTNILKDYRLGIYLTTSITEDLTPFFREGEYRVTIEDISFSNEFQDKIDQMTDIIMGNKKQDEVNESLQGRIKKVLREETSIRSALNDLINMLFDGFDDVHYDWGNYMCGMGECCDPYAIGFTLPNRDYDDYIFKLVDGDNYDDDADYPKHFRDELPEVCYEMPDVRNPNFNYIVFYEVFAEEIEEYLGPKRNWKYDLLNLINEKFHSKATDIIFI
jgi:hypothetical protein